LAASLAPACLRQAGTSGFGLRVERLRLLYAPASGVGVTPIEERFPHPSVESGARHFLARA